MYVYIYILEHYCIYFYSTYIPTTIHDSIPSSIFTLLALFTLFTSYSITTLVFHHLCFPGPNYHPERLNILP